MSLYTTDDVAYLDRAKSANQTGDNCPVLQEPNMVDKRPWMAHALMELLQLQRIGILEPGIGDFSVTDNTLKTTGRVLCSVKHRYLPSPSLSALSGGGVQIIWTNGNKAVEVSVFPEDDVTLASLFNNALIEAVDLGPADYAKVNESLAELMGL